MTHLSHTPGSVFVVISGNADATKRYKDFNKHHSYPHYIGVGAIMTSLQSIGAGMEVFHIALKFFKIMQIGCRILQMLCRSKKKKLQRLQQCLEMKKNTNILGILRLGPGAG